MLYNICFCKTSLNESVGQYLTSLSRCSSDYFPTDFPTKILYALLVYTTRAGAVHRYLHELDTNL
jgi:hypothetical protein